MIVVTGATGSVGQHLVRNLHSQQVEIVAAVRDQTRASLPEGVRSVAMDIENLSSVEKAVAGADAVFWLWPSLSGSETAEVGGDIGRILGASGARVTYLSAEAAAAEPTSSWAIMENAIEQAVAEWTILRCTGFAKNVRMWIPQIQSGDTVRWPFANATRSLIHEADIADAAAATLIDKTHTGQRYTLTGPSALRQVDQVKIIGKTIGRNLNWDEEPFEEARDRLAQEFGDLELAEYIMESWQEFIDKPEPVTSSVRMLTGHDPRSFESWVLDHAHEFRR